MNSYAIGYFNSDYEYDDRAGGNYDGTKSFVNTSTGTIETELGAIFTGGTITTTEKTIGGAVDVVLPDGSLSSVGDGSGTIVSVNEAIGDWTVKKDWAALAEFQAGGKITFVDVTEGTAGAADILAKFQAAFGSGTVVEFAPSEIGEGSGSGTGEFDSSTVNSALDSNEGIIFHEKEFRAPSSDIVIGTAGDLKGSVGFKTLSDAVSVAVESGKKFTLLGDGTNVTSAALRLNAGSEMDLGSPFEAVTAHQGGAVGPITNHGALNVRKGKFTTASVAGSGSLQIDSVGELISNAAVAVKNANIAGKLKAANSVTSTEALTVASGGLLKTTNIVAQGGLNAGGMVQANDIQAGNVNIDSTGIVIVDHLGEKINQNVDNRGTVLTSNMSNKGLLQMSSSSSLVVGDTNIETYYLLHLDLAKQVLENGGTVSELVKQKLIEKGYIDAQAMLLDETPVETASVVEDPVTEAEPESEAATVAEALTEEAVTHEAEAPVILAETETEQTQIIHTRSVPSSVRALAERSSSLYESARMADQAHRSVLEHSLTTRPDAGSLWAQGVYTKVKTDDFDSDTTGFSFGADGNVGLAKVGAAFTAQRGDVDSYASNDTESYSFSVYGSKPIAFGVTAAAGLTYTRATNELSSDGWEGKDKVDTILLGGRLVKPFDVARNASLAPYAGLDLGWMKAKALKLAYVGADPFTLGKTDEWFARVPMGIKASLYFPAGEGTVNTSLDASVTPQFGAKDTKRVIENVSYVSDFADDYVASVNLDVSYQGKKGSFSLTYGASQGNIRNLSHRLNAKASIYF